MHKTQDSRRIGDMAHSREALKIRRELDKQLAETAAAAATTLDWSAQERAAIDLLLDAIDRKCDLQRDYASAVKSNERVKLSGEIRLLEAHANRLLKQINTDVPAPESLRTIKARRAAMVRWNKNAG